MKKCLHCTNPINQDQTFCCKGCGVAYRVLHELNLQKYYDNCRDIFGATPQTVMIYNDYNYESHVRTNGAVSYVLLNIPEIVCGACVWLLEHTLRKQSSCKSAQINFAKRTLRLEWDASEEKLESIINLINSLGYNAVPISEHEAYTNAKQNERLYLKRIGIAGLGAFFTMMLAICVWAGNADNSMEPFTRSLFYLISLVIAVPALFYSADIFVQKAWRGLKLWRLDFNLSIALAIFTAVGLSVYNTFTLSGHAYFDSALGLVFALLLGKYLELKVRNSSLYECSRLQQIERNNYQLESGVIKTPAHLEVGEVLLIKRGQTIPIDCELLSDIGSIDVSIINGESEPNQIILGALIKAGSINMAEMILVKVKERYEDSFLYKLQQQVESVNCQTSGAAIAARIAQGFTPVVLLITFFTIWYWLVVQQASVFEALYIASTLLIITCPCAIGIAIPLAAYVSTNSLNAEHIIVKDAKALERLPTCKNIVFDKTGTLTTAKPILLLDDSISAPELSVLSTLAGLSLHPKSKMIASLLSDCSAVEYSDFAEEDLGVKFTHNNIIYRLGSAAYVGCDDALDTIFFAIGGSQIYPIKYQEELRVGAKSCINFFRKVGCAPWLISGDSKRNVDFVAAQLGVEERHVFANCRPDDKQRIASSITEYIMVGDGLNDSLILKQAAVSISHFDGADLSKYHSDVVFKGNDLSKLELLYNASVRYNTIVRQNFAIAIGYNALAIPLAFMGFVTPLVAAIFMSLSSICVVLNTMRLRGA